MSGTTRPFSLGGEQPLGGRPGGNIFTRNTTEKPLDAPPFRPIARRIAGFVRHKISFTSSTNISSEAVREKVIGVNLNLLFAG